MKIPGSEKTIFYIYEYPRFLFTYRKHGRGTEIDKVVLRTINSAMATTGRF